MLQRRYNDPPVQSNEVSLRCVGRATKFGSCLTSILIVREVNNQFALPSSLTQRSQFDCAPFGLTEREAQFRCPQSSASLIVKEKDNVKEIGRKDCTHYRRFARHWCCNR